MSPEDVEIVFFVMCMKYEVTLDYLNVFQLPICRVDFKLLLEKKKKPVPVGSLWNCCSE